MPSRPSNASPHTSQPASRLNSSQTARRMSGLSSTTKIAFVMGKPSFCEASKYDESADLRCSFRFMVFRGNLNLEGESNPVSKKQMPKQTKPFLAVWIGGLLIAAA